MHWSLDMLSTQARVTDNRTIQFVSTCMLVVGIRSPYKRDALVLFLAEKESGFWFLVDLRYRIQKSSFGWSLLLLQKSPKCSSCCEFLVFSMTFVLSPFVLAVVFEDLFKVVFFLLYVWNLLAMLSTRVSESLMCPVVHAEVWCWESWLQLYPVARDASWWTGGERLCSVWGQLCLRSLLFYYHYYESKSLLCVCMHAYYCTTPPNLSLDSPMTSFKLLSANILILTSLHPLLSFLSSRSVYFPPLSLLPPCIYSALQECLHTSNPLINSLLSQSHLI